MLKSMFEKDISDTEGCRTFSERQALDNSNALLEENEPMDLIDTIDLEALLKQIENPSKLIDEHIRPFVSGP